VQTVVNRILIVHAQGNIRQDISTILRTRYEVVDCAMEDVARFFGDGFGALVIDAPLEQAEDVLRVQAMIMALPKLDVPRAFVIDDFSHKAMVRAHAIGGEAIIKRPLDRKSVFFTLDDLLTRSRKKVWFTEFADVAEGLDSGTTALEGIFQLASNGTSLSQKELFSHGESVIDTLGKSGLGRWVDAVKSHHSQTFRHCLLVTGVATGFGQHLGMRRDDIHRLTLAALLHDVGKASIPLEILEKPAKLDDAEIAIMREHPSIGRNLLMNQGGFNQEMVDVVTHHHEFLDGSGYPDKLAGGQINDLVRIMTISDIFAALIEHRAYKAPMSNAAAFDILQSMKGKLDLALVRAFEPIAMSTKLAA